jgi:hypothetical protein
MNRKKEKKNTYSQTSRLENPKELQLHHNHKKFLFLTVLSLFAQCKMHYWWLVTWLDWKPELDRPSSHFFEYSKQSRETRMSDLGSQPREVWEKPGRLPAEWRLGSSENTSNRLFLSPAWPSLTMCHLFGIKSLVSWSWFWERYGLQLHVKIILMWIVCLHLDLTWRTSALIWCL